MAPNKKTIATEWERCESVTPNWKAERKKFNTTPTRQQFLTAYRAEIVRSCGPWAQDADDLNRFMVAVEKTLTMDAWERKGPWDHTGSLTKKTYRAIGGKGLMTLKALRALPNEDEVSS